MNAIAAKFASFSLLMVFGLALPSAVLAQPTDTPPSPPTAPHQAKLPPLEAGARYGQAIGALEICIGAKTTDKVAALQADYTGADQEAFKRQATKVYEAWVKVKNCTNRKDPNQCKIIMDRSCESAFAEIGPNGTAYPGLLDPPKY